MRFDVLVKDEEFAQREAAGVIKALRVRDAETRRIDSPRDADGDVVVVVGDTGFLLSAMRSLPTAIPVIGVGGAGFGALTEITAARFGDAARRIMRGDYWIEDVERMSCHIGDRTELMALNEAALMPATSGQFVRYSLWVDDELVGRDRGDGVIVATPTGSTAYALAAGGPVVLAKTRAWSIVPICSSDGARPVVVTQEATITLQDISATGGVDLVADGRDRVRLQRGEAVQIRRASAPARFVRLGEKRYTQILGRLRLQKEVGLLEEAPPSAKFLAKLLEYEGPLTQQEMIRESNLSERTVRNALHWLVENGFVAKEPSLRDARQDVYNLAGTRST
ncbi:MAG: NAD(+)/NADH kinase [Thermoplasmatota archaeon]